MAKKTEYDEHGLNRRLHASINDLPIKEAERKFHWDRSARTWRTIQA